MGAHNVDWDVHEELVWELKRNKPRALMTMSIAGIHLIPRLPVEAPQIKTPMEAAALYCRW